MTKFKLEKIKHDEHSFRETRTGLAYHYFGVLKIYSNKTQAEKRMKKLKEYGFNTYLSNYPFVILIKPDERH